MDSPPTVALPVRSRADPRSSTGAVPALEYPALRHRHCDGETRSLASQALRNRRKADALLLFPSLNRHEQHWTASRRRLHFQSRIAHLPSRHLIDQDYGNSVRLHYRSTGAALLHYLSAARLPTIAVVLSLNGRRMRHEAELFLQGQVLHRHH